MFECSYRALDGPIVQPAFRKNVVAQANWPAFGGNFGDFRKRRDSGDGGPDGIGSRVYGDDADGFWQSESLCLRQIRKKTARRTKNTITSFTLGEILMKISGVAATLFIRFALRSRCDRSRPERRRGFGERDRNFRTLPRFFHEVHYVAGLLVACFRIRQPQFLAKLYLARKNQQGTVSIYDQRICFLMKRLVALAASVHKYGHAQRYAFGAPPLEFNFIVGFLPGSALGLCALHRIINPAQVCNLRGRWLGGRKLR